MAGSMQGFFGGGGGFGLFWQAYLYTHETLYHRHARLISLWWWKLVNRSLSNIFLIPYRTAHSVANVHLWNLYTHCQSCTIRYLRVCSPNRPMACYTSSTLNGLGDPCPNLSGHRFASSGHCIGPPGAITWCLMAIPNDKA